MVQYLTLSIPAPNFLNEATALQGVTPDGTPGAFASAYQFLTALLSVDANGNPIYTDADMASINPVTWVSPDRSEWQKAGSNDANDPNYLDPASYVFIHGVDAVNANEPNSEFNVFIRTYTEHQFKLRFGEDAIPPNVSSVTDGVQKASDGIAQRIIEDMLNITDQTPQPNGVFEMLSAGEIAERDAQEAATSLFGGDQIGGWAGNPLFMILGVSDRYQTNILDQGTYEILAMLDSMREGLIELGVSGLPYYNDLTVFELYDSVVNEIFPAANPGIASQILNIYDSASIGLNTVSVLEDAYGLNWWDQLTELALGDIILGTAGEDDGLSGSDDPWIFADDELIHAGAGDDRVVSGSGVDILDGGEGNDTLDYSGANEALRINAITGVTSLLSNSANKDTFHNFETIIGTRFNDRLIGDGDTVFKFVGDHGNDFVSGGGEIQIGDDIIGDDGQDATRIRDGVYRKDGFEITKGEEGANGNSPLTINGGGGSITIGDWSESNDYGLSFEPDEEEPEESPVDDAYDDAQSGFNQALEGNFGDPLVLDMDGDGVELLRGAESNVWFDLTGDGVDGRQSLVVEMYKAANDNRTQLYIRKKHA